MRMKLLHNWIYPDEYNSTDPYSQIPMPKTVPTKPYDWTYTTLYPGHIEPSSTATIEWQPADRHNPKHTIPLAELTRHDPILFYAEIPLFEDELHDNGASHLLVRIVRRPSDLYRGTMELKLVLNTSVSCRLAYSSCSGSLCAWTTSFSVRMIRAYTIHLPPPLRWLYVKQAGGKLHTNESKW